MAIAVKCCIPKVTDQEMENFSEELKIPGERREGQLLANYDRLFIILREKIVQYDLDVPILFKNNDAINRLALTYFNTNREVRYMGLAIPNNR